MQIDTKQFVLKYFDATGSLCEQNDPTHAQILLAEHLSKKFGTDFLKLSFDAAETEPDYKPIVYGSEVLEKIVEQSKLKGFFTQWYISSDIKKQISLSDITRVIQFRGCSPKILDISRTYIPKYLFNFRIEFLSDDKHEEIKHIFLNHYLTEEDSSPDRYYLFISEMKEPGIPEFEPPSFDAGYSMACNFLEDTLQTQIKSYYKKSEHRLLKELTRITEYFQINEEELSTRLNRKDITEEKKEIILQKIKLNQIEKERKTEDIKAKYQLGIVVKLVNVALISVSMLHTTVEVSNLETKTTIDFFWNPITKLLEVPHCPICNEKFTGLCLCPVCKKAVCPKDLKACH